MARKKTAPKKAVAADKPLPVCASLVIADATIVGKDDVLSLIRIIDVVTLEEDKNRKDGEPFALFGPKLVAMLKAGDARGQMPMVVVCIGPKGESEPVGLAQPTFGPEPNSGINIITNLHLIWHGPGLYWIELRMEGTVVARTPFLIKIDPNLKLTDSMKKTQEK